MGHRVRVHSHLQLYSCIVCVCAIWTSAYMKIPRCVVHGFTFDKAVTCIGRPGRAPAARGPGRAGGGAQRPQLRCMAKMQGPVRTRDVRYIDNTPRSRPDQEQDRADRRETHVRRDSSLLYDLSSITESKRTIATHMHSLGTARRTGTGPSAPPKDPHPLRPSSAARKVCSLSSLGVQV